MLLKTVVRLALAVVFATGCATQQPVAQPVPPTSVLASPTAPQMTNSSTPKPTSTVPSSPTITITKTATQTPTSRPSDTRTPTISPTSTIALTPTRDRPAATINRQANCRYGPGTAYLYRWGLYPGDTARIDGRNWNGSWLWIKPHNLDSHCWASEIVLDVGGDPMSVPVVQSRLPHTTFAGPPGNVNASRNGSEVTVTWDSVPLSDDKRRGYMIEAMLCQEGAYFPVVVRSDDTSYTFTDEPGCNAPSSALLYTAEKHGYSDPVQVPWP